MIDKKLRTLYNQLLAGGCNNFYIAGIGGASYDDVDCLAFSDGDWEVCNMERGQKHPPIFTTKDDDEAIEFYYRHILVMEHWHLVMFTRSMDVLHAYRDKLASYGICSIQNDITSYRFWGDRIHRLFVVNKDIFIAKEKLDQIPFYDKDVDVYRISACSNYGL